MILVPIEALEESVIWNGEIYAPDQDGTEHEHAAVRHELHPADAGPAGRSRRTAPVRCPSFRPPVTSLKIARLLPRTLTCRNTAIPIPGS